MKSKTISAAFYTINQDNIFQEIFKLKDFSYGNGLHVVMYDI